MADSRRVLQGNQNRYRNAALDATLGREAHRERGAAPPTRVASNANAGMAARTMMRSREAHAETRVSPAPREAHFESAAESATPRGTVSADRLQRLGALLQRDENLARKLAKNPRRALASLDFISERDKQVLAGIDPQFWSQVAAVSDNFNVAAGKRAMAGLADAPLSIDGGTGYGSGGGAPYGWGGIGPPQGRGVGVGDGVFVHPGGRGGSGQGAEGDEGGGIGITDFGFGIANAGDPRPTGSRGSGASVSELTRRPSRGPYQESSLTPPSPPASPAHTVDSPDGKVWDPGSPIEWRQYAKDKANWSIDKDIWLDKVSMEERAAAEASPSERPPPVEAPPDPPQSGPFDPTATGRPPDDGGPTGPNARAARQLASVANAAFPSDYGAGPGPVGPSLRNGRAAGALRNSMTARVGMNGNEAFPSDYGTAAGPVGPALRTVREMLPADTGVSPVGPHTRVAKTAATWQRDVMPTPDDPGGNIGPNARRG